MVVPAGRCATGEDHEAGPDPIVGEGLASLHAGALLGGVSRRRWIAASTDASTTPQRPSRRSPPACATRSTWTPSPPSYWRSSTRPWSRPGPRSGCDLPHTAPRAQFAVSHGLLNGPTEHHLSLWLQAVRASKHPTVRERAAASAALSLRAAQAPWARLSKDVE